MTQKIIKQENIEVVLVRPRLSENIGVTARAAANMGLGGLVVVESPKKLNRELMYNAATRGGHSTLDAMETHADLDAALAGFQYVVGTTARRGNHRGPFFHPREMAKELIELGRETRVALLFGTERSGLTNDEIRLCQMVVRIPTADPKASSLNLAQAVLILGYELLQAGAVHRPRPEIKMASMKEVQAMYDHFSRTMIEIDFLPDQNTGHWLMSFKRIFNRSGLTHGDCNLIRGMCRQILWAVNNKGGKN